MSAAQKTDVQIGNRYGNLTVTHLRRKIRNNGYTEGQAQCRCDCGKTSWYGQTRLRRDKTKSCRSCAVKQTYDARGRQSVYDRWVVRQECQYRLRASRSGIEWPFSRKEFRTFIEQPCYYCDLPTAGGIDRRDNSISYTKENSVPCCAQCNFAKRTYTEKEFLNWVARIATKQGFSL